MKKRLTNSFRQTALIVAICTFLMNLSGSAIAASGEYYEIKVYHLKTADQEQRVDKYLQSAFIPALHRAGIKNIGVFKPIVKDTAEQRIYVFIPFSSMDQFLKLPEQLKKDKEYETSGTGYLDAPFDNPPYTRIESTILKAFSKMPQFEVPNLKSAKSERVYELRSYESATEKLYVNKVKMFNEGGEVPLFKRLGFNAVFYADVLSGSKMPNLMYMTTFENMPSREEHWKTFSADPEWKKLSGLPEYQHNVSHADIYLIRPTEYSDI